MFSDLWTILTKNPEKLNKKIKIFFEQSSTEQTKIYLDELATPENLEKIGTVIFDSHELNIVLSYLDKFELLNQTNLDLLCAHPNIVHPLTEILAILEDKIPIQLPHFMLMLQLSYEQLLEINRQLTSEFRDVINSDIVLSLFRAHVDRVPKDAILLTIPRTPTPVASPALFLPTYITPVLPAALPTTPVTPPASPTTPLIPSAPMVPIKHVFPLFSGSAMPTVEKIVTPSLPSPVPTSTASDCMLPLGAALQGSPAVLGMSESILDKEGFELIYIEKPSVIT